MVDKDAQREFELAVARNPTLLQEPDTFRPRAGNFYDLRDDQAKRTIVAYTFSDQFLKNENEVVAIFTLCKYAGYFSTAYGQ
jgi:hypothetical protein